MHNINHNVTQQVSPISKPFPLHKYCHSRKSVAHNIIQSVMDNVNDQVSWIFSRTGLAEWCTALCLPHRRSWVGALNLSQCLWTCLQICGLKRVRCRWESMQRDPPRLWNPRHTVLEVQNSSISGLVKANVSQNLKSCPS